MAVNQKEQEGSQGILIWKNTLWSCFNLARESERVMRVGWEEGEIKCIVIENDRA